MENDNFFVIENEKNSNKSLQASFKYFLKLRQEEIKSDKLKKKHKVVNIRIEHSINNQNRLRELFLKQVLEYIGVPYAKRYWSEQDEEYNSPFFLDCCGLVRRVMRDLRGSFGFKLGPWNQGYMNDLLPIEYDSADNMRPGDLVFVEGVYFNEKRRPQKHNIMHVEIWMGDGEKTVGARWQKGKIKVFDSYKYESQNYLIKRFIFKSIDTWLQGICRSFCDEHKWHFDDHYYEPGKYSIFTSHSDEEESAQDFEDNET